MAENRTTYTTIIDTQVNGAEQIEDLGDKAGQTDGKFKALRSQIRETNVQLQKLADEGKSGTAEFEKLRAKLDELNDAQDRVNFQAGQFDDQLSALPGPIGQVGGAIRGFNEGLNKFSTGFKLALGAITLIIAAIAAFREALSRTEEGQAKLNKITEAFEKIMNGLFAIIEPIAMLFADLIVELLESETVMKTLSTVAGVLTGTFTALFGIMKSLVGFVVNNFINAFKTLIDVSSAAGNVIKGVFTFDLDLIKKGVSDAGKALGEGFDRLVDNAKETGNGIKDAVVNGVTQGFETGANAFKEGAKRLTKEEREAAKKRAEEFKKEQEATLKELEAYQKVASDLRKSGRQKELDDNETQFNTLLEKAKKYGLDIEKLKEANRIKIADINKKYDKEEIEKNISALDQIAKDTDKALTDRLTAFDNQLAQTKELLDKGAIDQVEYAKRVAGIEKEITAVKREEANKQREEKILSIENEILLDEEKYNKRLALVNSEEQMIVQASKMAKQAALADESLTQSERESIITAANQRIADITKSASDERVQIQSERYDEQIANINAKEQELLTNTQLTEAQRTQIMIAAQQDRAAIRMMEIDDTLLGLDTEFNNLSTSFDRKRELINQKEALILSDALLTENQRTAIIQSAANERAAIDMAEMEAKVDMQNAYLDLAGQFGSFLKEIAGKNKKIAIAGVIVEQAAAIGKIVVNTGIANAKALAATPLTFGQPFIAINTISAALSIASSVAAGLKAIQQIKSSDSGSSATATSVASPRGGASVTPPTVAAAAAPQIRTEGGQNPSQQIADTIGAASGKPIKTYVLAQDVSSKQAFDRRTNNAASF
jgi:hypothetical protein